MSDPFTKDHFADLWSDFCEGFRSQAIENFELLAEADGLIELDSVTDDDLDSSFAIERGIEPGGSIWRLTEKGRARYEKCRRTTTPDKPLSQGQSQ